RGARRRARSRLAPSRGVRRARSGRARAHRPAAAGAPLSDGRRAPTRGAAGTWVGGFMVAVVLLAALVGPALAPYPPAAQLLELRLAAPSAAHPLGVDELG